MVEFLPSKQAVAGSSPVSRFHFLIVPLRLGQKPLHTKQAVSSQRGAIFFWEILVNESLPRF